MKVTSRKPTQLLDREISERFLGFRYLPPSTHHLPSRFQEAAVMDETVSEGHKELLKQGESALKTAIKTNIKTTDPDVTHILPLSGGLDSRAILGGLLDHINRENILAVTYGRPGTYDFEIPQQITSDLGIDHHTIDTGADLNWSEIAYNWSQAVGVPRNVLGNPLYHFLSECAESNAVVWSGYLADALVDRHMPPTPPGSWEVAINEFLDSNYSQTLTSPSFDPRSQLPSEPFVPRDVIRYDLQLNLAVRQQRFIRPVFESFRELYPVKMPFRNQNWLEFVLNISSPKHTSWDLYRDILLNSYPGLYQYPVDKNYGLSLEARDSTAKAKHLATDGFYKLLRTVGVEHTHPKRPEKIPRRKFQQQGNFREFISAELSDLEQRGSVDWLDIEKLWQSTLNGNRSQSHAARLVSLELFFKHR